jgi:hypothetical protein
MIAPAMIGDKALITRFAALPGQLRTTLTGEAYRLGRVLRDQVGPSAAVSLAVDSTPDGVIVTMATRSVSIAGPERAAGPKSGRGVGAPRRSLAHRFPRAAADRAAPGLPAALAALGPEIRAGMESAFHQVLLR